MYASEKKLDFGDQVEILGKSDNDAWLYVMIFDGTKGWIATEFVELQGNITQFPIVEAPPTATALPNITITIKNTLNQSNFVLTIQILDLGLTKRVRPGSSISFVIPGGLHTFRWFVSSFDCEKNIFVKTDAYWLIQNFNGVCSTFP